MKKILIAGGSGLIGHHLSKSLEEDGFELSFLSRAPTSESSGRIYSWNPDKGILPPEALQGKDVIINLAGAGIAEQRWTRARKKTILQSRLLSTKLLVNTLITNSIFPDLFINASAIGYYPKNNSTPNTEETSPGQDFLSDVCQQWEGATKPLLTAGIPLAILRFGIILSAWGGSLPKFIAPLRFKINPILGAGSQYISWMHIEDVCNVIHALINKKIRPGVYNMVSPANHTLSSFNDTLLRVMHRKAFRIRIPSAVLSLFLGELSSLLLDSQKVIPNRLILQAYTFKFPDLEGAISNLLTESLSPSGKEVVRE